MSGYPVAVVLCVLVVALLIFLLRTHRIREKFAAVWIVLSLMITVVGAVPGIAIWLADAVGVQTPVNLIFAVGFAVLVAVCLQLSSEVSNLEEETRTLAEEHALLALEVRTAIAGGLLPPASRAADHQVQAVPAPDEAERA